MNITRSNFNQTLPFITECIKKSQFIAMDFEMTGISFINSLRNSNLDSAQLRYWKAKENVRRFLPIQMGICPFQLTENKIKAYPFNFYIYPLCLDGSFDKRFLCQASALQFLSTYSFDFNKLIYEGIFYASHDDIKYLEQNTSVYKAKEKLRLLNQTISPEMITFWEIHSPKVRDFIVNDNQNELEIPIKYMKVKVYKHLEQMTRQTYPNCQFKIVYDSEFIPRREKMTLIKLTKEELSQLDINKDDSNNAKDDIDLIGFRRVIDLISELKLPLLVHNGYLDILHLYDKFLHPLPNTHKEFKTEFKKYFPVLYDTKYILKNSNILANQVNSMADLSSSYQSLLKYSSKSPIIELDENFSEYKLGPADENKDFMSHEAGFDAAMTGYIFFKSLGILNLCADKLDSNFDKRMKFYENRLPLGSVKVPFNLNEENDIYQDNEFVFYCENRRDILTINDVKKYFEDNFGIANIYPVFGEKFEYFIIFHNQESGIKLKKTLDDQNGIAYVTSGPNKESLLVIKSLDKYDDDLKTIVKREGEGEEMPKIFEITGSQIIDTNLYKRSVYI